jgi:long-subunit acyl-CoA synthetase (AMP-forming)
MRRNLVNPELQAILVGAGDAPQERLDEVKARGIRLAFGYGLTETSSGVAISAEGEDDPHALEVCPGSTITIADDGEVLIQTPDAMMQGYYKMPTDTAEVLIDGVLHTGDLGSFDENGRLHLQGRKKETLVLPGGTKIFLPEYEREIAETLGTSEMAVVLRKGLPVLVMGDLAASASEASAAAAANAYARANEAGKAVLNRLSGVMEGWPASQRLVDVVDLGRELPRTASGKVQRWIVQSELDKRWDEIRNMRKAGKATAPAAPTAETPAAEPAAATSPAGVTAAEPAADSAPAAEAPVAAPAQETAVSATDSAAPASEE